MTTMTTTAPAAPAETPDRPTSSLVDVGSTQLFVEERGDGPPLLLIHGAGEDHSMLATQADALAGAGYRVITYDRRGTGRSGRDGWPGGGADQHADDAAALLTALGAEHPTVLGFSSGGVVALRLAARHPRLADRTIAWEPPALGLIPGAAAINAEIMAPVDAHLAAHPGDFVGAQAILLSTLVGAPVTADDPAFAATRANAEPMVRDDPSITLASFTAEQLAAADVEVAIGDAPNDVIIGAVTALTELIGHPPTTVAGAEHEVYLFDPSAMVRLVGPAEVRS